MPLPLRQLRFLERPWPWLALGTFVCATSLAVAVAIDASLLQPLDRDVFARTLHGYTHLGLLTGTFAALALAVVVAYTFRKRWWQEQLPIFEADASTPQAMAQCVLQIVNAD